MREGILTDTTLATVDPAANRGNVAFFVSDPAAVAAEVCLLVACTPRLGGACMCARPVL